jgi:hypothetical protein
MSKIATKEPPSGASRMISLPRPLTAQPAGTTKEFPTAVFHDISVAGRSTFVGARTPFDSPVTGALGVELHAASPAKIERATDAATAPNVFMVGAGLSLSVGDQVVALKHNAVPGYRI